MGAGALVLTFGRLFQHVQSLPSSNSTSQQIQSLPSSNSTSQQIQYVTNNLVSSYKGTLPVILTCPHNGNQQPPGVSERTNLANCSGFTVIPDAYTRIITIELAQSILKNFGKAPYVVIAEFHRKYIDANAVPACAYESLNAQIYYNEYHNTIRKYVDEIRNQYNGTGFLFDIHASVVFPDDPADLYLGTGNGSTNKHLLQLDPNAMWGNFSLRHYLTSAGFVASPKIQGQKELHLNGGYTVRTYGSSNQDGIDAIQIEMAPSIRSIVEKRQVLIQALAEAVGNIVNHYA